MVQCYEFSFPSAYHGKKRNIAAYCWKNNSDSVRGIIQVIHGMQEHAKCYHEFAVFLANAGFVVYACDHLGHGKSVQKESDFGYFGPKNGWKNLVYDQHTLMQIAKSEYPELPLILFGHSMGSFVAREIAATYGRQLDMAIFMGSSGDMPLAKFGAWFCEHMATIYGIKTPSPFLDRCMTLFLNRHILHKRTHHDWISSQQEEVNTFLSDTTCARPFTYGGYRDLFLLLARISEQRWAECIPKELPILLISGKADPVGQYGKGIRQIAKRLLEADCRYVSVRLYGSLRHALLLEYRNQEIAKDILQWIEKQISKK